MKPTMSTENRTGSIQHAICVPRDGDVEASRKLCEQAQSCFSFVDREGMADATADVYAAVRW